jgi:uncharacterized protein with GYD domain
VAKYLFQSSYTAEGARGLLKEGGSSRLAYLESLAESLGGKLEAHYLDFGETDTNVVVGGIDNVGAAAVSLAVTASGARAQPL